MSLGRLLLAAALCAAAGCQRPSNDPREREQRAVIEAATSAPATPPLPDQQETAGIIFGTPVPLGNYGFAKRVAYMFPKPWEEQATPEEREGFIWEALILHFESFRRGVTVSDEELEQWINDVLKNQQQAFTRAGDPAAYERWVTDTVHETRELFENQMRYLCQIEKLKRQVRESLPVTVTEEAMQQEFLNEQHHVAGEMATFGTLEAAQAFYEQMRAPGAWDAMKASGTPPVRPVSMMTLEAYIDLWGVPKDQMYAFHRLPLGSIGPPMPFGKEWCVYRLLDKRTGDLANFPAQRESYRAQLAAKQQHEALTRWIEELKAAAKLQVLPAALTP